MTDALDTQVGKTQLVTYDGIDYDKNLFFGHTEFNHPEIDKKVYFTASEGVNIGQRYNIKIQKRKKLDLIGKLES